MALNSVKKDGIKARRRYELSGFRGVDTASAQTAVATKRSVDMRNMENRDGTNHKRYGWVTDVNQKFKNIGNATINLVFEASLGNKMFYFLHYGDKLSVYSEDGISTSSHTITIDVLDRKSYAFYSNDYVYFIGLGKMYVFGMFNDNYTFLDLKNNFGFTYIPKIIGNISPTGVADEQVVVEDYNLLTNYVRLGFEGRTNASASVSYKLPINIDLDKDFYGKVDYVRDGEVSTVEFNISSETTPTIDANRERDERSVSEGYFAYDGNEYVNKIVYSKSRLDYYYDKTSQYVQAVRDGTEKKPEFEDGYIEAEFSNGYSLKWYENELYLYNGNTRLNKIGKYVYGDLSLSINKPQAHYFYYFEREEGDINVPWTISNGGSVKIDLCRGSFYGAFPYFAQSNILKVGETTIGSITNNQITFNSGTSFNIASQIDGSDNIEIIAWARDYSPKVDLENLYIASLFGADGSTDRIFAIGAKNIETNLIANNLIYWTEYSDNENFYKGNAFTYWADTAYASIGATQSKIVAIKRLNDSSLAVFREKINNEPNFSIINATYTFFDTIGTSDVKETYLKVTSSSIDLSQQAENDDCFGNTIGSDVLFLSKNGVYSIKISSGTSVERYCQERSDPISNIFRDIDFNGIKKPEAIVYKNKYYLYVYNKKTDEDLVLVADARYRYTVDRNMDDTFNYEWYIWEHCPVNKWVIESDKLGFYDFDGNLNFFEEDNYIDSRKVTSSVAITRTDLVYNDAFLNENSMGFSYAIAQQNIGKKFKIEKGLCYQIRLSTNAIVYKYPDLTDTISSILTKFGITNPTEEDKSFAQSIYDFIRQTFVIKYNSESNAYLLYTIRDNEEVLVDGSIWSIYTNNSFYKLYEEQLDFVKAYWITPCLDLGATDYLKTLFTATIGIDDANYGDVYVGVKTRYDQKTKGFVAGGQFNMADLGFNEISFGKDFANAYTTKMKIRDFAYIQFYFGSEAGKDLAVNNITILYKYNTQNKGVH